MFTKLMAKFKKNICGECQGREYVKVYKDLNETMMVDGHLVSIAQEIGVKTCGKCKGSGKQW